MEKIIGEASTVLPYADLIKDWVELDKEWLDKHVAEHFRPIAAKHGRFIFNTVMQIGLAQGAAQLIGHHSQHMGSRVGAEIRDAAQTLANLLNDQISYSTQSKGVTREQLAECKQDIERMGALSMATPNSQGKIILPS